MTEDVEQLKQAFGRAIIARDHEALDVLLAPWLTVAVALEKVDASITTMRSDWELPETEKPVGFETSSGVLSYDDLRAPSDFPPGIDVPAQVTSDNYVGWHSLTLIPVEDADFDAWLDAWFAVVRLADGLHVGSLEVVDPD